MIEKLKISKVQTNAGQIEGLPKNPRLIRDEKFEKLKKSISDFPEMLSLREIVVFPHGDKFVCIGGNMRFLACRDLGHKEIIAKVLPRDFPVEKLREFTIKDNASFGENDFDVLTNEWSDFPLEDWGFDFPQDWTASGESEFGHDDADDESELDRLDEEGERILDQLDELQKKYKTAPGQIWQLGNHRIICGDATDKTIIARLMNGETGEILFTSPPYLDQRTYETETDLSSAAITKFIEVFAPLVNFQVLNLGIIRRDYEIVTYWSDFIAVGQNAGLKLLSWNVWDKLTPGGVAQQTAMFGIEHEFIFVFGKSPKKLNRTVPNSSAGEIQDILSKREQNGDITKTKSDYEILPFRQLGTVYRGARMTVSQNMFNHPAPFPVAFPLAYVEAMTDENQIVVEPFLGSGTTLIACEKLNRRCLGVELSPKYLAGTLERFHQLTGILPKLALR